MWDFLPESKNTKTNPYFSLSYLSPSSLLSGLSLMKNNKSHPDRLATSTGSGVQCISWCAVVPRLNPCLSPQFPLCSRMSPFSIPFTSVNFSCCYFPGWWWWGLSLNIFFLKIIFFLDFFLHCLDTSSLWPGCQLEYHF